MKSSSKVDTLDINLYNYFMWDKIIGPTIIFFSSVVILLLGYYKIPISYYQQIILILLIILLIIFSRFSKLFSPTALSYVTLFLSSLFVQALLVSTGGIFSPFLILFHLFSLGTSFLINIQSFVSFLVFGLLVLFSDLWFNPNKLALLQEDPGKALLLGTSFIVIIPLALMITKIYHLKDQLSKMLGRQAKLGKDIVENLSELVVITDKNLKINFVNEALKKLLNLSDQELKSKALFDILNLKDLNGIEANGQILSIDNVLTENTTHIIGNLLLYTKSRAAPYKVTVQVRPIVDQTGKVEQLSFIITESQFSQDHLEHKDLDKAQALYKARFDNFKTQLKSTGLTKLSAQAELLSKIAQDLALAEELTDHPIKENAQLTDIALLSKQIGQAKQNFAKILGVNLKFSLPDSEQKEYNILAVPAPTEVSSSDFTIPADKRWVTILIEKLIEMAILLASAVKKPRVLVIPSRLSPDQISLIISGTFPKITTQQKDQLFTQYYGDLGANSNLGFGSGLEGFIAKSIATQLNIDLDIRHNPELSDLAFIIHFSQKTRST